jgi:NADPH-dependent 7-cyano-7-deazaguanine reductase QueF
LKIATQPNEKRCHRTRETHILPIEKCCPVSGNPERGSEIHISYDVGDRILEVESLRNYVDSYIGGRGEIRSMEGMVQAIAQDCANSIQAMVHVVAELNISPNQRMRLECSALVTETLP